jgi:hypothetical protein
MNIISLKHLKHLKQLGLLALLATTSACDSFQPAKFNAPDGVGKDAIFVVPFSEPRAQKWYGESERGQLVADILKTWVMTNATPNFPEGPSADEAMVTIRDWRKDSFALQDWKTITATLGVRYVLFGEIEEVTLQKPSAVGFVDASIRASYRVVDIQESRTVWWRKSFPIEYARKKETDAPTLAIEVDPRQVERKLLGRLAETVGQDLYGYTPEGRYN